MAVAWPSIFPAPLREGFVHTPGDRVQVVVFEAGPGRVYTRFKNAPLDVPTLSLKLRRSQYAMFKQFYGITLESGAVPVAIPLDLGDGQGIAPHEGRILGGVRFDDTFSPYYIKATFRFQVLSDPVLDADIYNLLLEDESLPDDFEQYVDRFDTQYNEQLPAAAGSA